MTRFSHVARTTIVLASLAALRPSADAADWIIDSGKSNLGFSGTQSGNGFQGHFTQWQGEIRFDPNDLGSSHAHIVIDMGSAKTGDLQKDTALPTADWFNSKQFPQAIFDATHFQAKGGNHYEAAGTLTIRGIQKSVTLPFTLDIAGDTAHAVGDLPLIRSDFGVGQGAWQQGTIVALAVSVHFELTATVRK